MPLEKSPAAFRLIECQTSMRFLRNLLKGDIVTTRTIFVGEGVATSADESRQAPLKSLDLSN
jgi:hypothetical protein